MQKGMYFKKFGVKGGCLYFCTPKSKTGNSLKMI